MRGGGQIPRAGSGVVRTDPLHILARCCKRRLNQVLSILYLSMFFNVLLFIRAPFYVSLICIGMCSVFWLFWLSCQYLPSYWREREHKNNQLVVSAPNLMILGETITSATNRHPLTISVPPFTVIHSHSNQHRSVARLYTRHFLILINDP